LGHRSIPSSGVEGCQPGRALQRRVKLAREGKRRVVVIEQREVVGCGFDLFGVVLGDFGQLGLAARATVVGVAAAKPSAASATAGRSAQRESPGALQSSAREGGTSA
jgi:hypothetical protein